MRPLRDFQPKERRVSTLSVSIQSELNREIAVAQREAELLEREAELAQREAVIEHAEIGFIERERALAAAVGAVEAQRQRLVEVRDEYEERRQTLTERARELEHELQLVRAAQQEVAAMRDSLEQRARELGKKEAAPAARGNGPVEPNPVCPAPPVTLTALSA
jgi:chromosome segregation ATPase